jgi:predicted TIM-barrel fold metal-dependent hydrolase
MVIDTHVHVLDTNAPAPDYYREGRMDATVETLLREMDRAGVDQAFIISYTSEDIAAEFLSQGRDPKDLAQVYSKEYAVRSWAAHRDRFWWFTDHVDPLDPQAAEKLERDLDAGASGVKLLPVFRGALPNHRGFFPVYELCARRSVPIILDLSFWYLGKYTLHNTAPEEAARIRTFGDYAALLAPIFEQFSAVRFQLAHCGAVNLWDVVREKSVFRPDALGPVMELVRAHPNVTVDVAAIPPDREFWRTLVPGVGAGKVSFGTDWPYFGRSPEGYRRLWEVVADERVGLSREQREMVLSGTALGLLS